jgi:hypothetical protein
LEGGRRERFCVHKLFCSLSNNAQERNNRSTKEIASRHGDFFGGPFETSFTVCVSKVFIFSQFISSTVKNRTWLYSLMHPSFARHFSFFLAKSDPFYLSFFVWLENWLWSACWRLKKGPGITIITSVWWRRPMDVVGIVSFNRFPQCSALAIVVYHLPSLYMSCIRE